MQGFDPLAVPISEICSTRVPCTKHLLFPPGVYTGSQFFNELDRSRAFYFDCITYSANKSIKPVTPLRRLITCLGESWSVETRQFTNIHTKLYVLYSRNHKPIRAFTGSQNLVLPTTENIMIDVSNYRHFFVEYFNTLWQTAYKK